MAISPKVQRVLDSIDADKKRSAAEFGGVPIRYDIGTDSFIPVSQEIWAIAYEAARLIGFEEAGSPESSKNSVLDREELKELRTIMFGT